MSSSYADAKGVFFNKLGIDDARALSSAEYSLTTYRARELETDAVSLPVQGYGLDRLQAIHKHLFQDVYDWAGMTRTVPSSKRSEYGVISRFAEPEEIVAGWQVLEEKCNAFASGQSHVFEQNVEALVQIFVEANHLHPFPEGNGRSLQSFMKRLAKEQGIELDFTKIQARQWNHASAVSGTHFRRFENLLVPREPDTAPIRKLFADMAQPGNE